MAHVASGASVHHVAPAPWSEDEEGVGFEGPVLFLYVFRRPFLPEVKNLGLYTVFEPLCCHTQ